MGDVVTTPNTAESKACPLNLPDCDMWADGGRIDMHYQPHEVPRPCAICGNPLDHYGHAHGVATGHTRGDFDAASPVLPGPIVEDALRPYTDNPRHAAIAVMNALRKAGLKVVRYVN